MSLKIHSYEIISDALFGFIQHCKTGMFEYDSLMRRYTFTPGKWRLQLVNTTLSSGFDSI